MEKIDVKYDPLTGTYTTTTVDEEGKMHVHKAADLEPVVNYTRALQNADEYKRNGIKNNLMHVAHIPEVLEVKLLQHGVDVNRDSVRTIVAKIKELGMEHFLVMRGKV